MDVMRACEWKGEKHVHGICAMKAEDDAACYAEKLVARPHLTVWTASCDNKSYYEFGHDPASASCIIHVPSHGRPPVQKPPATEDA